MGNLGTRRRGFLRSHTATAPSTTTTTDLVLMEFPAQDCHGAAERDPATSPVTSERRRLIIPRIRPRRQRRTQGVQRPIQPRERKRWTRLQQPRLWEQGVQRQEFRLPQKPREQLRQQRPPRQGVRRENVWRSAERKGYNRGYGRSPNYSNQDNRGSRESSGEPGGRMNGALEHEGRPPFRYGSRGSTPRRDSSAVRVTCWHCGQRGHYSTDCSNPPTDRMSEHTAGPSTTMRPALPSAQPTAPHPKAGAAGH